MNTGERDSSYEAPIVVEWNSSEIRIYDIEGILRDADENEVSIYDEIGHALPIGRVQVKARTVRLEEAEEDAYSFNSSVQIFGIDRDDIISKFRDIYVINDIFGEEKGKLYPFALNETCFESAFEVYDEQTADQFMILIEADGEVTITDNVTIEAPDPEDTIRLRPPSKNEIPPVHRLTSLMKLTSLVVDFTDIFDSESDSEGRSTVESDEQILLKNRYNIGLERKIISPDFEPSRSLSKSAIEHVLGVNHFEDISEEEAKQSEAITFNNIGGLEGVKRQLQEIVHSFKNPEIMKKWGANRPQGVLLAGEPGTGKTMLAHALANEIGADLFEVQSSDIYGKWLGESEKKAKELFELIKNFDKPTVVLLDEIDGIVGESEYSRSGSDSPHHAVASIFKQELNDLSKSNPNVLLVATTNHLDNIDPSIIRSGRFDYIIKVPMPDKPSRQSIIAGIIHQNIVELEQPLDEFVEGSGFMVFSTDLDSDELSQQTDGFNGADLAEIFRRLKLSKAMVEARTGEHQPPISQADILQAIKDFRTGG